jgi:hypothetical protein
MGLGTQRGQTKGVLSWLVRWAYCAGQIYFLFCLGCFSRPSTKYYILIVHFSIPLCPSGQAAVPGRLSFIVCLCLSDCNKEKPASLPKQRCKFCRSSPHGFTRDVSYLISAAFRGRITPSPGKIGLKLVCDVNIVYGNFKYEKSQDYAQKSQRNCTLVNSASVQCTFIDFSLHLPASIHLFYISSILL